MTTALERRLEAIERYNEAVRDLAAAQAEIRELEKRVEDFRGMHSRLCALGARIALLEAVREGAKNMLEHRGSGELRRALAAEENDATEPPQNAQEPPLRGVNGFGGL